MPEVVRAFNEDGIAAFSRWLQAGAIGAVPPDLLDDNQFSNVLAKTQSSIGSYKDRYELGCGLVEMLRDLDSREIAFNRGLWTWLAAQLFDQICPINSEGTRTIRRTYVYVLSDARVYYRHLVRTPWFLVSRHGEACRFLLVSSAGDPAPLSRQSYLLDQLAARQFVIASPTLIAAATRMYVDTHSGRLRRGAGAKGRGSPRRLALIANQLSLTYDIHDMPIDNFMKLLPDEFSRRI